MIADDHGRATLTSAPDMMNPLTNLAAALVPAFLPNSALNYCLDSARRIARRGSKIQAAAVVADDRRVSDTMLLVISGPGIGRGRRRDRMDRDEEEYGTFKQ